MEFKVVSFVLGNEDFGVDIMKVDSIVEFGKIIKIPESADFVEGVMNIRGKVVPIINLRKKFYIEDLDEEQKKRAKVVVINLDKRQVGLLVDDVKEVLSINQDQLEEPPSEIGGVGRNYILGIAKLNDSMMVILDIDKILSAEEKVELGNIMENVK
ncbi:MAG: purine-binding chemotaxis protein CheW [Thermotogaceae bacterium]|nr:purine-binding chemotaxis protein CheW [Thermotogaceae bacterium]